MSPSAKQRLLLDALTLPPPRAGAAWRNWRSSTNLDRLDHDSFLLLPALAGRMPAWIADDPQQGILKGICRRAWSQNQLQRKLLADGLETLDAAGIQRVAATGPVLWGALYWPEGAIRPIETIDLLVEPDMVRLALETLFRAGWKAPNGLPDTSGKQLYFAPGVLLQSPYDGHVRLHWRALPNTDLSLRRPEFPPLEPMPSDVLAPYRIPLEHSLVAALGGVHADSIDWHFDALLICRQPDLRWEKVAGLLRWRSGPRRRLDELRAWGTEIPQAVTKPVWTSGLEQSLASALRAYRSRRIRL